MKKYEEIKIEIVALSEKDVITTSGAFNGRDDTISNWEW